MTTRMVSSKPDRGRVSRVPGQSSHQNAIMATTGNANVESGPSTPVRPEAAGADTEKDRYRRNEQETGEAETLVARSGLAVRRSRTSLALRASAARKSVDGRAERPHRAVGRRRLQRRLRAAVMRRLALGPSRARRRSAARGCVCRWR